MTSGLGRYVPTSLLLPVLRAAMCEREGVPKRVCLASMAYEVALYLTAALVLGAYFVIDLPELQGVEARLFSSWSAPVIALSCCSPASFTPSPTGSSCASGASRCPSPYLACGCSSSSCSTR